MVAGLLLVVWPSQAHESRVASAGLQSPASLPDGIPFKRDQPLEAGAPVNDHRRTGLAMVGGLAVLAVLAVVVIARRRLGAAGTDAGTWRRGLAGFLGAMPAQEVQRVSGMALSPRHSLHVVVWNGQRLLLGCTEQSIQLLAETSLVDQLNRPAAVESAQGRE